MTHGRNRDGSKPREQWTEEADSSIEEGLHDRLASYPAHARLELTPTGNRILEALERITAAFVQAMRRPWAAAEVGGARRRRSSTEWATATGFRTAGDVRKLWTGEAISTGTDLAALYVVDRVGFRQLVEELCHMAGGRFEPLAVAPVALEEAVADLALSSAQVTAETLHATSPKSDGGTATTAPERRAIRSALRALKENVRALENRLENEPETE